jgi:hypothetical protein
MLFFLRYINPVIAVLVLVICLISASTKVVDPPPPRPDQFADPSSANPGQTLGFSGFFKEPMQVYFLGKGIFCSTALFLLGKLVEHMILLSGSFAAKGQTDLWPERELTHAPAPEKGDPNASLSALR